ncbi:hypothetical protein SSP531S_24660 [Streptomyces spongiicola]|uniref:Uncharacterized protein n=1 Tax=Streptomyces spongiicola TaxID=1690221 RepID=A0A388SXE4_9ACTN|nr:hypothetical protein [Streptomyces spongiicola]GBQ01036.1 hypothetical protein SSP531S_24660 [Streptomyces spongiicola]
MQPETPTPDQARETLDTARREANEARALVETLADRVRDGDTTVTADQLGGQKQLADLAQLRVEAAERKLQSAIAADRHARCTAAVKAARDLLDADTTAPLVDAVTAVRAAVAGLVAAVSARNDGIAAAGTALETLNQELSLEAGTLGQPDARPLFEQYRARGDRRHLFVGDAGRGARSATALSTIDLVCAAVTTVLITDPNSRHLSDRMRLPDSVVRQLGETVPGLADAWRVSAEEWLKMRNTTAHTRASQQGRAPVTDPEG